MQFILKLDKKEMDTFLVIFFNGITVPVSSQSTTEKRLANKVVAMGQRYEDSLIK